MEEKKKKISITSVRIIVFLAITFIVTYALEIGLIMPMMNSADAEAQNTAYRLLSFCMIFPMTAMFITRVVTVEGLKDMWFVPKDFRNTWKYYLLAWLCPSILSVIGMVAYFVILPSNFDPNMGYMVNALGEEAATFSAAELQNIAITNILVAFVLGPILNIANCIGEEWGFRGYLLPKCLEKMSILPTVLFSGVIWGLWNAPLICMGLNYGLEYAGYPYLGIAAMCLFCTVVGVFLSYVTIRTQSCIPAALAHAAINGIATTGIAFTLNGGNPLIGPEPTGILGGIGFVVAAVVVLNIMLKEEKKMKQENGTSESNI